VPAPAREAALEILRRLSAGHATLADALASPAAERLDERDRGLVHELVLGTLRRRGWLDHVLGGLSTRPLGQVDPGVLDALRLGVYQVLFLRVPPHAAVSETVDLARAVEPRAAGFANAVLRRLLRHGPPTEPDPGVDPLGWLTSAGSLPRWLAERWLARLGARVATERARAALEVPPTYFRLNPRRADARDRLAAAGVEALEVAACPGALEAQEARRLLQLAAEGIVYVQDLGSQVVGRLAASEGLVLDACAAPGGKALLVDDLGAGRTRVVAAEASRRRVGTLARLRSRWGDARLLIVAADARRPPFACRFDTVLLDAPCSGLGTLARNPDLRWRLAPGDVERHAARQAALIDGVARLVRPGGRLVYATCSLEAEETDGVVAPFLRAHPEFEAAEPPAWAEPFRAGSFLRVDPLVHRADGFFAACLRRAGPA
jgi:16S rRNA (cytosine967-C5)-methyltransferase